MFFSGQRLKIALSNMLMNLAVFVLITILMMSITIIPYGILWFVVKRVAGAISYQLPVGGFSSWMVLVFSLSLWFWVFPPKERTQ